MFICLYVLYVFYLPACFPGDYVCPNNVTCLPQGVGICDMRNDCGDWSDEEDCGT